MENEKPTYNHKSCVHQAHTPAPGWPEGVRVCRDCTLLFRYRAIPVGDSAPVDLGILRTVMRDRVHRALEIVAEARRAGDVTHDMVIFLKTIFRDCFADYEIEAIESSISARIKCDSCGLLCTNYRQKDGLRSCVVCVDQERRFAECGKGD